MSGFVHHLSAHKEEKHLTVIRKHHRSEALEPLELGGFKELNFVLRFFLVCRSEGRSLDDSNLAKQFLLR